MTNRISAIESEIQAPSEVSQPTYIRYAVQYAIQYAILCSRHMVKHKPFLIMTCDLIHTYVLAMPE